MMSVKKNPIGIFYVENNVGHVIKLSVRNTVLRKYTSSMFHPFLLDCEDLLGD